MPGHQGPGDLSTAPPSPAGEDVPARQAATSRSLRLLLLAAVALPLALTATAAWIGWRDTWREARQELERTAEGAAEYARRVLDGDLMAVDRVSDLLRGLSDEDIRAREAELHAILRDRVAAMPQVAAAFVVDRHGRFLLSSAFYPVRRDVDASSRDPHRMLSAPDAPAAIVTQVYRGLNRDNLFFSVAQRRRETGNRDLPPGAYDGQVNASVDPHAVGEGLRRLARLPEDALALIRGDGAVLARSIGYGPEPGLRLAAASPMLPVMARGDERAFTSGRSAVDGVWRLAAYRKVEGWPVYAVAGRSHGVVLGSWYHSLATLLAVGIPASLALFGLALLVGRGQRALLRANQGLEARVAERTAALAASEAQLRHVQRVGRVGGYEVNLETRLVTRAAEHLRLDGAVPMANRESYDLWLNRIHPEDRDRAEQHYLGAIAPGATVTDYAQEYRVVTATGEVRWIAARAEIIRDSNGRALRMVGAHLDVTDLKATQQALAEGEGRLRAALRGARLGTWERHLPSGTGSWDSRAAEIYGGLTPEQCAADLAPWRDRVHPEDRAGRLAAIESAVAAGGPDSYDAEFRFRRDDGGWNRIAVHGSVVERDPVTGRGIRLAGVVQDVTQERQQEAQRLLLMRELDHRAKNALAVVQAALHLTPKQDPVAYAKAVGGRVSALARAHTLLAAGRWQGADLQRLAEAELVAFLPAAGTEAAEDGQPRAYISGPALQVTPGAAQALSMALHELATNAVKYGALSVPGGQVRVRWEVALTEEQLRLTWRESGGPAVVAPPEHRGFGSRVIEATIRDQLGGQVTREWPAEGLWCRITLPLDRVAVDSALDAALVEAVLP